MLYNDGTKQTLRGRRLYTPSYALPIITTPAARAIWWLAEEIESLTRGDYTGRALFQGNLFKVVFGGHTTDKILQNRIRWLESVA